MNTQNPNSIAGRPPPVSYEPMLKESIDHFLTEFRRGSSNFSVFQSIFFRLFQTMPDPPLEVIWFYSAITYHSSNSTIKELSIAKDLFKLLISCSSPSTSVKNIAVLAPVVYELYYRFLSDLPNISLSLKREIEGFVEGIISYISICCSNYSEEDVKIGLYNPVVCFSDLVRVWTVDRVGENCKIGDNMRVFLPLLRPEICVRVIEENGVGYLAGIVMIEVFVLSLCLKIGEGISTDELEKDTRNLVIQIIKGFQSCSFLDMLLKVLLEPSLPITTLLKSKDELQLRSVLYDAVILEGYSFLNFSRLTQPHHCNALKNLSLLWLFVVNNAIEFVRENGDYRRTNSYTDAFSVSDVPNQLIQWVTNQEGMNNILSIPKSFTPRTLIKWLLVLDDQGLGVFEDNVLKLHAETAIHIKARSENEANWENQGGGDQEMVDILDHEVSIASNGRRKREGGCLVSEGVTRIKLVRSDNFAEPST